jgi:TDG/mug DNA glycosylase family protein
MKGKIALWDVLASAERLGSLDAKINFSTCVPNDFKTFFDVHKRIRLICFNGAAADNLYHRTQFVLPNFIPTVRLPSTSPANARIPHEAKLAKWITEISSHRLRYSGVSAYGE